MNVRNFMLIIVPFVEVILLSFCLQGYQAPQILEKLPYNPKHADVWSLGALLYTICVGRLPLGTIRNDIIENASKELRFPANNVFKVSHELQKLLKGMLAYKPEMR